MAVIGGGFWVEVRFKDYSSRLTYMHIYFEFSVGSISNLLGAKPLKIGFEKVLGVTISGIKVFLVF